LAPIYIAASFAVGFLSGVNYGATHENPWEELANRATEFALWARRTATGGPEAPDPDVTCPGQDAQEESADG